MLLPLRVLHHGADDEVVGDGADDGHRDVGNRILQAEDFHKKQHQTHPHDKEVEHVGSDDADEVEGSGLRLECPIDGQEVVDAKRDEVTRDKGHLVRSKEAHDVEDGCVYHGACAAHDAETHELLRFLVAQKLLNRFHNLTILQFHNFTILQINCHFVQLSICQIMAFASCTS